MQPATYMLVEKAKKKHKHPSVLACCLKINEEYKLNYPFGEKPKAKLWFLILTIHLTIRKARRFCAKCYIYLDQSKG